MQLLCSVVDADADLANDAAAVERLQKLMVDVNASAADAAVVAVEVFVDNPVFYVDDVAVEL